MKYLKYNGIPIRIALLDVEDAIRKPSVYTADVPHLRRDSDFSRAGSIRNVEVLAAKKRQSITVHNHDFEIVEAMKRRSALHKNTYVINEKRLSCVRSIIPETIEENPRNEADEKAIDGTCFKRVESANGI